MLNTFSVNMSLQIFFLLNINLIGFFIFTTILPSGFCIDKTDERLHFQANDRNLNYMVDPKNWHSWTPVSSAGAIDSFHEGIPLSLDQQQKLQKERKQSKKVTATDNKQKSRHYDDLNISDLRKKAFTYGKLLFDFVTGSGGSQGLRNFFPDNESSFSSRQGGAETGRAGVVDWLARLIGVQGKTLGEFLREYQVHVLYDLVFTFFKWVFFLYAGLLIP